MKSVALSFYDETLRNVTAKSISSPKICFVRASLGTRFVEFVFVFETDSTYNEQTELNDNLQTRTFAHVEERCFVRARKKCTVKSSCIDQTTVLFIAD